MSKIYKVSGYIVHSDVDIFDSGCEGKDETYFSDTVFISETLKGLLIQLSQYTGMKDYELNACEENGRIDFQGMTLSKFGQSKPRQSTLDKWEKGEIILYLTDYSFYVKLLESEIDLQTVFDRE